MSKVTCSVAECAKPRYCRGWCIMHYNRWAQHGSLDNPRPSLDQRFWLKVGQPTSNGCREWTGSKNPAGYGTFHMGDKYGRPELAHRMALTLSGVEVTRGLYVCHHCDNPPCCEPSHLYVGTPTDNVRDMWKRGRGAREFMLPFTKLSDEQVLEVRRLYAEGAGSYSVLANRFGVSTGLIGAIVLRKRRALAGLDDEEVQTAIMAIPVAGRKVNETPEVLDEDEAINQ